MDGQRFDAVARAVARGATRREALRLVGGGLAGALLAAVGAGKRAGAQDSVPCDELRARCFARGEEACGPMPPHDHSTPGADTVYHQWEDCVYGTVPACRGAAQQCSGECEHVGACQNGCPGDQLCIAVVNPGNHVKCRCISL